MEAPDERGPHTAEDDEMFPKFVPADDQLPSDLRVTDFELEGFAEAGSAARARSDSVSEVAYLPPEASTEEREEAERQQRDRQYDEQQRRRVATDSLRTQLTARVANAYNKGLAAGVTEQERRSTAFRGYALFVLVLAVVAMPFVAIIKDIAPDTFGAYIAPVTGIAGTVVGYWFGSASGTGKSM